LKKTLLIFLICLASPLLMAQVRQAYFDEPALIVLPKNYNENLSYPVFLALPWTTGTGEAFYRYYQQSLGLKDFILIFPKARPTRAHYLPDFISFVRWFEERVHQDLKYAQEKYSVNTEAIYAGGYSLGGDLSWALLNRNPGLFKGIMAFGTRCSYPARAEGLKIMSDRGVKAFFGIGNREDPARSQGISRAQKAFENAGITSRLDLYSGAHTNPPRDMVSLALRYLQVPGPVPNSSPKPVEITPDPPPVTIGPLPEEEKEPVQEYQDWFRSSDDWFKASSISVPENWDSWSDNQDWFKGENFFRDSEEFFR